MGSAGIIYSLAFRCWILLTGGALQTGPVGACCYRSGHLCRSSHTFLLFVRLISITQILSRFRKLIPHVHRFHRDADDEVVSVPRGRGCPDSLQRWQHSGEAKTTMRSITRWRASFSITVVDQWIEVYQLSFTTWVAAAAPRNERGNFVCSNGRFFAVFFLCTTFHFCWWGVALEFLSLLALNVCDRHLQYIYINMRARFIIIMNILFAFCQAM